MTRLKGFENIATELKHVAEFITCTTPSEYHAMNASGGANPNYKGHSVRDGQAWLNRIWSKARAKLKRLGILIYGFRIAEPHHDGTPHWHMVLFTLACHRVELRTVLREYWLSECAGESGARDHRIKFLTIDTAKGSACGYLAKYVAKNIDGHEVGVDFEADNNGRDGIDGVRSDDERRTDQGESPAPSASSDASNTAQRVGAWAALHGIRQFQQIGGPQVTIYRELRRIRSDIERGQHVDSATTKSQGQRGSPAHVAPIERARVCADAGDWGGFISSNGGIEAGRQGSLSLWKETTGECNAYTELRGPQIVGVNVAGSSVGVKTHTETWSVVQLPPVNRIGTRALPTGAQILKVGGELILVNGSGARSRVGVASGTDQVKTRHSIWRIERKCGSTSSELLVCGTSGSASATVSRECRSLNSPLGPVTITVRGAPGLSEPHGWTNPNETSMYGPK